MNIYWQWSSDGDYQPPDHTTVMWMITGIATFDDSVEERTKLLAIMFGRDRPAGDLTTPNWLLINTTRKTYLRRLTGVFLDSLSWIQLYNGPANVMKSDGSFWERESDDWGIYGANGAMQLVDDISIDTQQGNTSTVYQQTFGIRRARYDAESQQANYYVSPGWMAFGYASTALDKYVNTQTYVSSNKRDNYIFFPMNYVDVEAYDLVVIINGESNVLRFCGTVSDKKWSNSDYLLKQNVSTWSIRTNGLTEATGVELYRSVSTTANSPAETSYNPVTSIGVDTTTIANVIVKEIPVELYIKLTANKSLYIKHDVWKNAVDPYRVIHSNASGVLTKLYVDTITKYLTGKTDGVVKKVGFWNNNPTHVTGNDIRIDNMVFNSDSTASMSNITGTESKKACDIETTIYGLVDRSNATYIANSIIGEYQNNYSFIITINKINYECTRFEERDIDDAGLFIPGLTGVLLCWKYSIGNNDTEYVYSTAKYPHKGDVVYKETLSKYQVYSVNSNNVAVLYSISTIRAVDTSTATAKIQINVLGDIDTNASSSSNVVLKWYSRATQYDRGSRVFDENTGTWVNINGSGKAWLNEETHTVVYTTEEVPSVGTQVYRVFINNRESSHNKYTTNPPTIVYAGSDIKRNGKDTRYDKPDITASHSEYAAGIKDDWTRPKPFVGRYIVIPLDSTGSTQLIIVTGIFIHDYEGEVYLKIPSNLTGPYGNNVVACSFTAMTDEDTDVCRQMSAFFHGLSTGTCQVTAGIMERYDKHANGHYTKFNWMIAYINKPATV